MEAVTINKMYQTTILLHSTGKLISKTRTGLVLENQSDALDIIGGPTPDSSKTQPGKSVHQQLIKIIIQVG